MYSYLLPYSPIPHTQLRLLHSGSRLGPFQFLTYIWLVKPPPPYCGGLRQLTPKVHPNVIWVKLPKTALSGRSVGVLEITGDA